VLALRPLTFVVAVAVATCASGCASTTYAQVVRLGDEEHPFAGCESRWETLSKLRVRCPGATLAVEDSLRVGPATQLRDWPEQERQRRERAAAAFDAAPVHWGVDEVETDAGPWPVLRVTSLDMQSGAPTKQENLSRLPFGEGGAREVLCEAAGAVGQDRCDAALPFLMTSLPRAELPDAAVFDEGCEEVRFPLGQVVGASRRVCAHHRAVVHERAQRLPEAMHLLRAWGLPSGSVTAEERELPPVLDAGAVLVEARAFVLKSGDDVRLSGVLSRQPGNGRGFHCAVELPPETGVPHCYRAAVLHDLGDDGL
jgi:hypothetical protein